MATYELVRNANVEVTKVIDPLKRTVASVVINGQYEHRFPHTSRVSKHLDIMEPKDLAERLTGGSYFFINDELVDFRDGNYNGFVHTEKSIDKMVDLIGWQRKEDMKAPHLRKKDEENTSIVLRKVWTDSEIVVPGYAETAGAEFNSVLSFVWNPFVKTVNSAFDLIRLVCTNGMVGITSFLNSKVPLVNRWEEHLDIAAKQIQNKVNSIVIDRVGTMIDSRASVTDLMLLNNHAFDRLYASREKTEEERQCLINIMAATDTRQHLSDVYKEAVFLDKNLGAQLPGHLSTYDAFNIATELRSHTNPVAKSSDFALDRFANSLVFDREDNFTLSASRYKQPVIASFSSPERAFYGKM